MNELQLQKRLQKLLSEPSRVWITESGKQLQVLSPGRINPYEGPDFTNFGVLLDGKIVTGKTWQSHPEFYKIVFSCLEA